MPAKYILAVLAAIFLLAAAFRRTTGGPPARSRTWLLVGAIFAAVSTWLFFRS
jgi:hypothetical protein